MVLETKERKNMQNKINKTKQNKYIIISVLVKTRASMGHHRQFALWYNANGLGQLQGEHVTLIWQSNYRLD
jgi:hypothetical protein